MTCDPFQVQLEHLTMLAMSEFRSWQVHAWRQAKTLESDPSGLWMGLTKALEDTVAGLGGAGASVRLKSTKQP